MESKLKQLCNKFRVSEVDEKAIKQLYLIEQQKAALIKARDALQSLGGDTADIQARDDALTSINSVLGE